MGTQPMHWYITRRDTPTKQAHRQSYFRNTRPDFPAAAIAMRAPRASPADQLPRSVMGRVTPAREAGAAKKTNSEHEPP